MLHDARESRIGRARDHLAGETATCACGSNAFELVLRYPRYTTRLVQNRSRKGDPERVAHLIQALAHGECRPRAWRSSIRNRLNSWGRQRRHDC